MKFGQITDQEVQNHKRRGGRFFDLPSDPPRNAKFFDYLKKKENGENPAVILGLPLWGCKEWIGDIYPPKTSAKNFLKFYSQKFRSIEMNATFYKPPSREQLTKWRSETPPHFLFCPKVPRQISEGVRAPGAVQQARDFFDSLLVLEKQLGLTFLQLGPRTTLSDLPYVEKILHTRPVKMPIAVEFRNISFFENGALKNEVVDMLYRAGASSVISDTLGEASMRHLSICSTTVMIRFLGSDGDLSDRARMEAWAERIEEWISKGIERVFFFVHQPQEKHAPKTLFEMRALLRERELLAE